MFSILIIQQWFQIKSTPWSSSYHISSLHHFFGLLHPYITPRGTSHKITLFYPQKSPKITKTTLKSLPHLLYITLPFHLHSFPLSHWPKTGQFPTPSKSSCYCPAELPDPTNKSTNGHRRWGHHGKVHMLYICVFLVVLYLFICLFRCVKYCH